MRLSEVSVPFVVALWFVYSIWVLGTPFLVDADERLTIHLPDAFLGLVVPLGAASALASLVMITLGVILLTSP